MNLDLTALEKAVAQLADAIDTYHDETIQANPKHKKHMRSAVIQSFEFTYEVTLKMIKRHLGAALSNPAEVASMNFKDVIREAYKKDLVRSDVSIWEQYRENRGITSHTYDEEKAQDVFEAASEFLHEAQYVLSNLQHLQDVPSQITKKPTKKELESKISELESKLRYIAAELEKINNQKVSGSTKKSRKTRS